MAALLECARLLPQSLDMAEFVQRNRDMHQAPELAFAERLSGELVAQCLQRREYQGTHGLGGIGAAGQLRRGAGCKKLGLRANMVASSIGKQSAQPNAGTNMGLQHACGLECHDVMTLVATKHLARTGCFDRTLTLISQCAEEDLGGANKWRATASSADCHAISYCETATTYASTKIA